MNTFFLIAGLLCFVLGLVHSILGEVLIFNSKRKKGSVVPSKSYPELIERHLRIIWATWHLASVFGWCLGAILVSIAFTNNDLNPMVAEMVVPSIIYTMVVGALLVLIGTKGKHPGWIILLLIGILVFFGN